jgi:hypothetical protein
LIEERRNRFVAKHGDISVELDALPVDALRERIISAIASRMDLDALGALREVERAQRETLAAAIGAAP